MYDQEPFDRLTLDAENKNAVIKVVQLDLPNRKVSRPQSGETPLKIRLPDIPGQEFQVLWKHVVKVELFEELILQEAQRLTSAGELDDAFRHFEFLITRYPETPQLNGLLDNFLFLDAGRLFRDGRYAESLGVLEELKGRNPNYARVGSKQSLNQLISATSNRVINNFIEKHDYRAARAMIERLDRTYPNGQIESTVTGRERLNELSVQFRDKAQELFTAGQLKKAQSEIQSALNIWPSVEGGKALAASIFRQYPLVRVAVGQRANQPDGRSLINRSARRIGRLLQQTLVRFDGPGREGGEYQFPWGEVERSDDRLQLTFRVNASNSTPGIRTGYDITPIILASTNPSHPYYLPDWASIFKSVKVSNVMQVQVNLRKPHVLPESLLQLPIDLGANQGTSQLTASPNGSPRNGAVRAASPLIPFLMQNVSDSRTEFVNLDRKNIPGPAEIVELNFESSRESLAALRRGDVDAIDLLFPADAAQLLAQSSRDKSIQVKRYAMPTIHMLVPNFRRPFVSNQTFRRGLLYTIDRAQILKGEFLGGREVPGCRLVSGPFPAPESTEDAMSYAYDETIQPLPFDPGLGKLYTLIAMRQVAERAKSRNEPAPEFKELVLVHPASEAPRVACVAIASHLNRLGIKVALRELSPGEMTPPDDDWDLVYLEVMSTEPLVDAKRLLGTRGLLTIPNAHVGLAIRNLEAATSWRDVSVQMQILHRAMFDDCSILPLWQTIDFFAHRSELAGVRDNAVSLYQHVQEWQIDLSQ